MLITTAELKEEEKNNNNVNVAIAWSANHFHCVVTLLPIPQYSTILILINKKGTSHKKWSWCLPFHQRLAVVEFHTALGWININFHILAACFVLCLCVCRVCVCVWNIFICTGAHSLPQTHITVTVYCVRRHFFIVYNLAFGWINGKLHWIWRG